MQAEEQNAIRGRVLCGANADKEKYYFNPDFASLPAKVQEELKSLCVLFTEQVGGTLLLVFESDGTLKLNLIKDEDDYLYDEIEAELQVSRVQKEKEELFGQLERYYREFFLKPEEESNS